MNQKYCLDKKEWKEAQAALLLAKQLGLIEDAGIGALEKRRQKKMKKTGRQRKPGNFFMDLIFTLRPCIFNMNSPVLSWISCSPRKR